LLNNIYTYNEMLDRLTYSFYRFNSAVNIA